MKLRNFMYATMIACAFASCSKDDVTDPDITPVVKGDASLSIAVDLADVSNTKAETDKNALVGETTINSIEVALYNGNIPVQTATNGTTPNKASFTGLAAGEYTYIVLANMPAGTIQDVTPAALTKTLTIKADGFKSAAIPMYGTGKVTVESGDNGEKPVLVYRNVARVQLNAIKLDMANTVSDFESGKDAKFVLNSVSVNDAPATGLITGAAFAEKFVKGLSNYGTDAVAQNAYYLAGSITGKEVAQPTFAKGTEAVEMAGLVKEGVPAYYFYVFSNTSTSNITKFTVAGEFSLASGVLKAGGSTSIQPVLGYYPITIGYDGVTAEASKTVVNNMVYNITLNIAGPGYTTPGPTPEGRANFTIVASAAPWSKVINQDHTIK